MSNYVDRVGSSHNGFWVEKKPLKTNFEVEDIVNKITQKINTYEQYQSEVKVDLDKYANIIKETDLRVSRFRNKIVHQIDQITSRFKEAKNDTSISQEELSRLSDDIEELNYSLSSLDKDDQKFSKISSNINSLRSELDKLCSQQSVVISKLEELTQREVALSSQNDELSSLEIFRIKRQLKQIRNYRGSLEKKMDSLNNKVSGVKKKLESNFQDFDKYKSEFEDTYLNNSNVFESVPSSTDEPKVVEQPQHSYAPAAQPKVAQVAVNPQHTEITRNVNDPRHSSNLQHVEVTTNINDPRHIKHQVVEPEIVNTIGKDEKSGVSANVANDVTPNLAPTISVFGHAPHETKLSNDYASKIFGVTEFFNTKKEVTKNDQLDDFAQSISNKIKKEEIKNQKINLNSNQEQVQQKQKSDKNELNLSRLVFTPTNEINDKETNMAAKPTSLQQPTFLFKQNQDDNEKSLNLSQLVLFPDSDKQKGNWKPLVETVTDHLDTTEEKASLNLSQLLKTPDDVLQSNDRKTKTGNIHGTVNETEIIDKLARENFNIINTTGVAPRQKNEGLTKITDMNDRNNFNLTRNFPTNSAGNSFNYPVSQNESILQGIDRIDFSQQGLLNYRPDFLKDLNNQQFDPIPSSGIPRQSFAEMELSNQLDQIDNIDNEIRQSEISLDDPVEDNVEMNDNDNDNEIDNEDNVEEEDQDEAGEDFIEEMRKRLVYCQDFLKSSNINKEIVTEFIKEIGRISFYFDSLISEFQRSFSMVVVFKTDISRLLPNKKKIHEGFLYFNSEINAQQDRVRMEYTNFSNLYGRFKKHFSFYKKQIFYDLDIFNSFSSDLKELILWVKSSLRNKRTMFFVDCNGLLESWIGLNERYSHSWVNIANVETFLNKATEKISTKIENLQVTLQTVSKYVNDAISESNSFVGFWNDVLKKLDNLFLTIKNISKAVVNRVRDINIAFDKTIDSFESGINTTIIENFNNSLDLFYGVKNEFENQIKEFQIRFANLQGEYDKFLVKRKYMLETENDLYLLIDDIKQKQELLFDLLKEFYIDLENNLLSLNIFVKKIADDQDQLFNSYNGFVNQYPEIRDYIINKRDEKTWMLNSSDEILLRLSEKSLLDNETPVGKEKVSYSDVLQDLQEKNNLFLKLLTEYNNKK